MSEKVNHSTSIRGYLLVFGGLALLTGLTVVLSYLHIPIKVAIVLAALISLIKCSLIGAFFMHLRFEGKLIYSIIITAFLLLAILIFAILPDIGR